MSMLEFLVRKLPIIREHLQNDSKIKSDIASRGYTRLPGLAHAALVGLEAETRERLAQALYEAGNASLSRSLEVDGLKQSALIDARRFSFEQAKARSIATLQQIAADARLAAASAGYNAELAFAKVELREIMLAYTERALRLQQEELKRQAAELETEAVGYERSAIDVKLALVAEKLKLIPYLQSLSQYELEVARITLEDVIPATQVLMVEEGFLIDAEQAQIPHLEAYAAAREAYALRQPDVLPYHLQKAAARLTYATDRVQVVQPLIDAAESRRLAAIKMVDVIAPRLAKAAAQEDYADSLAALSAAEVVRANKRAEVAQAELQTITPLQQKAAAAQSLSLKVEENANSTLALVVPAMTRLSVAETALIAAEREQIPYLQAYAEARKRYAQKQPELINPLQQKAAARKDYAISRSSLTLPMIEAAEMELEANTEMLAAIAPRLRRAEARVNYASNLLSLAYIEEQQAIKRLEVAAVSMAMIGPLNRKAEESLELAGDYEELAKALEAEVADKKQIAIERVKAIKFYIAQLNEEFDTLNADFEAERKRTSLSALRAQYQIELKVSEGDRATAESHGVSNLSSAREDAYSMRISAMSRYASASYASRARELSERIRGRVGAVESKLAFEADYIVGRAEAHYNKSVKTAEIAAMATLGGELTHVLSGE